MKHLIVCAIALLGIASPVMAEVVCETKPKKFWLTRQTVRLGHETKCHRLPESQLEEINRLNASCDLLIKAYGEKLGQIRCRELVERIGIDQ